MVWQGRSIETIRDNARMVLEKLLGTDTRMGM